MRHFLVAALLLVLGFAPTGVHAGNNTLLAVGHGAIAPIGPCSGSQSFDGCTGAPAPTTALWQQSNAYLPGGYFNTTSATKADYTRSICGDSGTGPCNPTGLWKQAGVGYAIGSYGMLADPVIAPPQGCAAPVLQSWGGLLMQCGSTLNNTANPGSFNGTFNNVELGNVNGHDCVAVQFFATTGVTALTENDVHWFNNNGLCTTATGGGANVMSAASGVFPGGITVNSAVFDGNSPTFDTLYGGASCVATSTACNPAAVFFGVGNNPLTINYSVIRNFAGRPISSSFGTGVNTIINFSWIEGWNARSPDGHAEFLNASPPAGEIDINYSVVMQPIHIAGFGPGPWFFANTYSSQLLGMRLIGTTWIAPYTGGASSRNAVISGCIGAPPAGGTAASPTCVAGADGKFYQTNLASGDIGDGYGANVNCSAFTFTGRIDNGTLGSGIAGTVLTVTGTPSPPLVVGELLTGGGVSGANGGTVITAFGTGTGGAGNYTVNNSQLVASPVTISSVATGFLYKPLTSPTGTTPPVLATWGVDGFSAAPSQYYPNWATTGSCQGIQINNQVANNAIASGHAIIDLGPVVVQNNFFDISSQSGVVNGDNSDNSHLRQNIWTISAERTAITGWTGHITGNQLTIDSGSINTDRAFISGAGIDGCGVGGTMGGGCPHIISGTGPYTLSASNASPVATEAMEAHYPTVCNTISVFSGNSDMTGVLAPSSYEGWTNAPLQAPDVYGCS